jgi:hypothetical protein
MTNYKNNLPPYVEEQIINEEVINIQQILNQFKQLVPKGFTELGQPKKYWGSTEGLDKLLCERYTFKYDNKSYTLDIDQELSNKLKLTPKDNFCVKEEVLSRLPEEGGITLNNEEEIFLRKSFTVENLEEDIDELFGNLKSSLINSLFKNKRIRELNNCLSFLRSLSVSKNQEITGLNNQNNNLQVQLNQTQTERDNSQDQVNDLTQQLTDANNLINNLQNLLGINDLNNLPVLPQGETLYSLLERPTQDQYQGIIAQLNAANSNLSSWETVFPKETASQVQTRINILQTDYNFLNNKINTLQNELAKEKGWWDEWINDENAKPVYNTEVIPIISFFYVNEEVGRVSIQCLHKEVPEEYSLKKRDRVQFKEGIKKFVYENYINK